MLDVILCCYNSENTIEECVESILSQTYKSFKLYIFDDCSTDKTIEKIKQFKDNRITIISSKVNVGTYAGKNIALKAFCDSPYVALHDSDDISEKTRFEKQLNYMKERNVKCVGTSVVEFWDNGISPHTLSRAISKSNSRTNLYPAKITRDDIKELVYYLEDDYDKYLKFKFCMNGSVMFDKKSLLKIGGWDGSTRVAADTDLFIRILSLTDIHNIQECLYRRRFHKNSLTASKINGINSEGRKAYNLGRIKTIKEVLKGEIVSRDFYYPEANYRVIKCVE
jgi:glycosyltransferase involved in cell wall biosynthesis